MQYFQGANFPPRVTHSCCPILPSTALDLLQAFLVDAESSPHLHPDALLTEGGPQRSSAGEGLILHNLRRVEAGLRGERLGKDLSDFNTDEVVEYAEGGDEVDVRSAGRQQEGFWEEPAAGAAQRGVGNQWEDFEDYQLKPGDDVGDVVGDEGMQGVLDGGRVPAVKDGNKGAGVGPVNKEERKRKKRERRIMEKKEAAEKKRKEKEMEGKWVDL
ncbi:MAG: hypothetical protein M1837_000935 [Sclerophora amabilis]|nr:MAG: hypothetical protein M1837_000935 [Sclerophora amabilis]